MLLGLNSSGWASGWSLDALLEATMEAGMLGVELQMGGDHGVSAELESAEREQVREAIGALPLELVGLATDVRIDQDEADEWEAAAETLRATMQLSHDVGGFGVTMHARELPDEGAEGLGERLKELADFGMRWGQQVRLELAEACAEPGTAQAIFSAADHPSATLSWACRPGNISEAGLEHDFRLLESLLGETVHIGALDDDGYPYFDLLELLGESGYAHWVLLRSAGEEPEDVAEAIARQRRLFEEITGTGISPERRLEEPGLGL